MKRITPGSEAVDEVSLVRWANELPRRAPTHDARQAVADLFLEVETRANVHGIVVGAASAGAVTLLFSALGWYGVFFAVALSYLPVLWWLRHRGSVNRHTHTRLGVLEAELKKLEEE